MADLKARDLMVRGLFPIPSNVAPDDFRCIVVYIPDDMEHYAIFAGAFALLTKWNSWQKDGTTNAVDASNVWKAAFDMSFEDCCESAETRVVDGQTEYSPDGVMFYRYPGALENPQWNSEPRWPSGSVPSGETAECLTAANIVETYRQTMQSTLDSIGAGATLLSIVLILSAIATLFISISTFQFWGIGLAFALLGAGTIVIADLVSEETLAVIQCAINCNVGPDGSFTPEQFQDVEDYITANIDGVQAGLINQWLDGFGPVGLTRMANGSGVVTADCSACDCGWCYVLDFTIESYSSLIESLGNGVYVAGVGYQPSMAIDDPSRYWGIGIKINMPTTGHITSVSAMGSCVGGSNDCGVNGHAWLMSYDTLALDHRFYGTNFDPPDGTFARGGGVISITDDNIIYGSTVAYSCDGTDPDTLGTETLTKITICGDGINPFA